MATVARRCEGVGAGARRSQVIFLPASGILPPDSSGFVISPFLQNTVSIYGLLKALRRDLTKRESLSMATIAPTAARNPIPWQRRLRNIAYLPKRSLVKRFMDDVIQPAMTLVQEELNKQGTISHISDAVDDRIRLEVDLGNELNFIYEVRLRGYISPTFALAAMDNDEQQTEQHRYYRAEVYLKEGGQNYDVMGWNQEQLINDILDQYEKHLHFLHLVR